MNTAIFDAAYQVLSERLGQITPQCGFILGSGWSSSLEISNPIGEISYADIPGLGASTVAGHTGKLVVFEHGRVVVAAFMGRRHWYEGAGWEPVVLPVELLRRMGVTTLLVTNAAGGINPALKPGDLVMIVDHINTVGVNPLIGPVYPGWGTRFPDQTVVYTPELQRVLLDVASEQAVDLLQGIYAFTSGPVYETPSEIRAYASMGADVVGMSTVPEITVASAAGMQVGALSCVTNMAAGIAHPLLSHTEVLEQTRRTTPLMQRMLTGFLQRF